jgi:hypothetical protein
MKNADARFIKKKYLEISKLGTKFNLSFSSQFVLTNKIIALDGIKKCLLVLNTDKELNQPYIIDLNKISAVTLKKSYGSINQGELKHKGTEDFLERIDLKFEFSNKNELLVLPFYECEIDNESDRPRLERNARNWQLILSKIVGTQKDKTINESNQLAMA